MQKSPPTRIAKIVTARPNFRPNHQFQAVPSTLRAFTEPAWIERCTWKHEAYLSKVGAKFLLGSVVRVEEKAVHLADGSTVPFDYVVIVRAQRPGAHLSFYNCGVSSGCKTASPRALSAPQATGSSVAATNKLPTSQDTTLQVRPQEPRGS